MSNTDKVIFIIVNFDVLYFIIMSATIRNANLDGICH